MTDWLIPRYLAMRAMFMLMAIGAPFVPPAFVNTLAGVVVWELCRALLYLLCVPCVRLALAVPQSRVRSLADGPWCLTLRWRWPPSQCSA